MSPVPPSECVRARESISAQLDLELSELDSARLSAHLRKCPECGAHAREVGAIAAQLRAAPLERPELEIWLPHRRWTAALRAVPVRAAAAAAAVAVAATASFAVGQYVATSGHHGSGAGRPQVRAAGADVVQRQVLAMLRDAQSRPTPALPGGRLIFV